MIQLEVLRGTVEYDVFEPGHPKHFVARAVISGRVKYPRLEDHTYPHPYKSAWNGVIFISVTQEALDNGTTRPVEVAEGEPQFGWDKSEEI